MTHGRTDSASGSLPVTPPAERGGAATPGQGEGEGREGRGQGEERGSQRGDTVFFGQSALTVEFMMRFPSAVSFCSLRHTVREAEW